MFHNYSSYFFRNISKKLRLGFVGNYGRNNSGKITVYHKSSGHKKKSYKVDFYKRINCFGYVMKIIKTPFYSSYVGFIIYENGLSSYILLSENQNPKKKLYSGDINILKKKMKILLGYCVLIKYLDLFNMINNIELIPYKGSTLMRSAGSSGLITSKIGLKTLIKLKSGWNLLFFNNCMATLGIGSNSEHKYKNLKKAGISRALGIRPTVRGVAMNPCDHPHGGGEGKKSGSVAARSPWGWLTKGTVSKNTKVFLAKKKKFKKLR